MKNYFKNKTVLVTGAAGFLGSHLVDKLLQLGANVIGVDNLISGREENIAHLFEGGMEALSNLRSATRSDNNQPSTTDNFALITADVVQSPLTYLPEDVKLDLVFHLASPASPPVYQRYPVETYLVNSLGTHHLLDYLQQNHPHSRFVYASTSEVYGDPKEHPQPESYWGNVNPNGVRSCYDESKRLGETMCGVFEREMDLDVRIMRIFNTYGPRINPDDGRVIPNFIKQALGGQPLTIYGHGQQTRSYCYVDDLIEGMILLSAGDGLKGQTVNLGNPDEHTVLKTAEIIQKMVGSDSQLKYSDLPLDDPTRRQPDISKAKKLLNWQPKITFEQGLEKTIEHFRQVE